MEGQFTPAIGCVLGVGDCGWDWFLEDVETVVVSRGSISDVPRVFRVVETSWVDFVVKHGRVTLVCVDVSGENEVDGVVEEDGLEDVFAFCANG